jgi:hypothetical protein
LLSPVERDANIRIVPKRSDLSGALVDTDAARELEIRYPDGRRRKLRVSADEAEAFADKGADATKRRTRALAWARAKRGPVARWLLVSVLGVVLVQALTRQSADRQKELEFKHSLASDVASSSYHSFAEARSIAFSARHTRTPERKLGVLTQWIADEGRIDAAFRSYLFPPNDHPATRRWIDFRGAFYAYLTLACCEKAAERSEQLASIEAFLRQQGSTAASPYEPQKWRTLACRPSCSKRYAETYDWLGRQLLLNTPVRPVEGASPEGFCVGLVDLIRSIVFLSC